MTLILATLWKMAPLFATVFIGAFIGWVVLLVLTASEQRRQGRPVNNNPWF